MYIYVCDWLLERDKSGVLSGLPVHVSNIHSLLSILQQVESAEICAGNPDNDFVSLIEREGGQFKGMNKEIVATLDDTCNVKVSRHTYLL